MIPAFVGDGVPVTAAQNWAVAPGHHWVFELNWLDDANADWAWAYPTEAAAKAAQRGAREAGFRHTWVRPFPSAGSLSLQTASRRALRNASDYYFRKLRQHPQWAGFYGVTQEEIDSAEVLPPVDISRKAEFGDERLGCVYVWRASGNRDGLYKVGATARNDPIDRIVECFNEGICGEVELHLVLHCDAPFVLERQLHQRLAGKRFEGIGREWYSTSPEEVFELYVELT